MDSYTRVHLARAFPRFGFVYGGLTILTPLFLLPFVFLLLFFLFDVDMRAITDNLERGRNGARNNGRVNFDLVSTKGNVKSWEMKNSVWSR